MDNEEIKNEIEKRGIKRLVHFSRLENLDSIIEFGLWPRTALDELKVRYIYNDDSRMDGYSDASCLSIGFPNYKMFYYCRMKNDKENWIVLTLSPDILWQKDCAFCHKNAASRDVACIPLHERKKTEAFFKLFEDGENFPKRSALRIPISYPTNPQAEILVFEPIEAEYIKRIVFQCPILAKKAEIKYEKYGIKSIFQPKFFSPRGDFKHWKDQQENLLVNELF